MEHPDKRRALLTYEFPLAEMITGYYDKLKSVSRGYASMDYDFLGYRAGDLVKIDILVKEIRLMHSPSSLSAKVLKPNPEP